MAGLFAVGLTAFLLLRWLMVPEGFGELGHYRVGAIADNRARQPDGSVDAGILAAIRTGVLAVAAIVVAGVGRHARFREWDWLVYPLLVGIGVKVVAQDFMHGRPATLFVALALYGAALIMAPRVRRRQA
jgi:hypothetical protein